MHVYPLMTLPSPAEPPSVHIGASFYKDIDFTVQSPVTLPWFFYINWHQIFYWFSRLWILSFTAHLLGTKVKTSSINVSQWLLTVTPLHNNVMTLPIFLTSKPPPQRQNITFHKIVTIIHKIIHATLEFLKQNVSFSWTLMKAMLLRLCFCVNATALWV